MPAVAMAPPERDKLQTRRANIRLAVVLGLVAVGFYVSMFYFLTR